MLWVFFFLQSISFFLLFLRITVLNTKWSNNSSFCCMLLGRQSEDTSSYIKTLKFGTVFYGQLSLLLQEHFIYS